MCGIFGYYNYKVSRDRKAILEFLFTGLRRLEYRGYDSAGISIDSDASPSLGHSVGPDTAASAPNGLADGTASRTADGLAFSPATASENVTANGSVNGLSNGHAKTQDHRNPVVVEDGSSSYTCTPIVIKSSGKIDALVEQAYTELKSKQVDLHKRFDSHAGIAHTRWATHGQPSTVNCHPHVSDEKHEFVVVHNGIITNYKPLKDFLVQFAPCMCPMQVDCCLFQAIEGFLLHLAPCVYPMRVD